MVHPHSSGYPRIAGLRLCLNAIAINGHSCRAHGHGILSKPPQSCGTRALATAFISAEGRGMTAWLSDCICICREDPNSLSRQCKRIEKPLRVLVVDREIKKLRTTVKSAINLGQKGAGSTLSCGTFVWCGADSMEARDIVLVSN
jgi:hypothetical protein